MKTVHGPDAVSGIHKKMPMLPLFGSSPGAARSLQSTHHTCPSPGTNARQGEYRQQAQNLGLITSPDYNAIKANVAVFAALPRINPNLHFVKEQKPFTRQQRPLEIRARRSCQRESLQGTGKGSSCIHTAVCTKELWPPPPLAFPEPLQGSCSFTLPQRALTHALVLLPPAQGATTALLVPWKKRDLAQRLKFRLLGHQPSSYPSMLTFWCPRGLSEAAQLLLAEARSGWGHFLVRQCLRQPEDYIYPAASFKAALTGAGRRKAQSQPPGLAPTSSEAQNSTHQSLQRPEAMNHGPSSTAAPFWSSLPSASHLWPSPKPSVGLGKTEILQHEGRTGSVQRNTLCLKAMGQVVRVLRDPRRCRRPELCQLTTPTALLAVQNRERGALAAGKVPQEDAQQHTDLTTCSSQAPACREKNSRIFKALFAMGKQQLPRLKWQILPTLLKRWKPQAAPGQTATPCTPLWLANRKKIGKKQACGRTAREQQPGLQDRSNEIDHPGLPGLCSSSKTSSKAACTLQETYKAPPTKQIIDAPLAAALQGRCDRVVNYSVGNRITDVNRRVQEVNPLNILKSPTSCTATEQLTNGTPRSVLLEPLQSTRTALCGGTLGYRAAAQVRAMLSPGHLSQDFYTSTMSADMVFCSRPRPAEAQPGQTGRVPLACRCWCEQLPCPRGTGCDFFMQLAQLQGRVVQDVYGEITSNHRVLGGPKRPPSVALAALSALLCPVASSFSRDLYPLQLKERSSRLTAIQLPVFSTEEQAWCEAEMLPRAGTALQAHGCNSWGAPEPLLQGTAPWVIISRLRQALYLEGYFSYLKPKSSGLYTASPTCSEQARQLSIHAAPAASPWLLQVLLLQWEIAVGSATGTGSVTITPDRKHNPTVRSRAGKAAGCFLHATRYIFPGRVFFSERNEQDERDEQ
ncbi:hypothetical protein Anapl_00715 [Anas platyrhynchos]|uniref:Uncharacterized protein n=1 Tax=Anas platyrhynchos TaxID=8839 RepID=R0L4D0_ANAPL|nr:hypothetical protein Anapl_00715 [Anas platyrhynchos]